MKDIPGYEGEYAIETDGRIWSHKEEAAMAYDAAARALHGSFAVTNLELASKKPPP